jgi:hypothetical protein
MDGFKKWIWTQKKSSNYSAAIFSILKYALFFPLQTNRGVVFTYLKQTTVHVHAWPETKKKSPSIIQVQMFMQMIKEEELNLFPFDRYRSILHLFCFFLAILLLVQNQFHYSIYGMQWLFKVVSIFELYS